MNTGFLAALGVPARHRATVVRHTSSWALLGLFAGGAVQQLGFIVRKTGGSPLLVAAVTAGPSAFALLTVLYSALLENRPARSIVAASRCACAALFVPALFVPAPIGLAAAGLAALVIAKIGDTFYGRLLAEMYPKELRGRLQSLPLFAQALAVAAASMLAGWVLSRHPSAYRWFLPAIAPAGVAAAVLITKFPDGTSGARERDTALPGFWLALAEVGRDRPFLIWTLVYSAASLGFWLVHASLPVYFASVLRFGYWENGAALAAFNAVYCVGFLLWGRILDRVRSLRTMVASWSLVGAGTLVTALGGSFAAALAGQAVYGFALAGNDIAWYPVVLEFAPDRRVDRYMSVYMTVFGARALLGGALGGLLMESSDLGSRTALVLASCITILGSAGMLLVGHKATPASSAS